MISNLKNHRSIREYLPDPISSEMLNEILECGLRASSGGNMQAWSVLVTRDPSKKEILYKLHLDQEMIREAPVVLTFCSDFYRMRRWCKVRNAPESFDDFTGFLDGAIDAIIAAQNVAVAAESLGLGICYLGTTIWAADKISELLELPDYVVPVTSMVLGRPAESPVLRDRLPLDGLVHEETYKKWSDEEVLRIYAEREVKGWERINSWPEMSEKLKAAGIAQLAHFYPSDLKYPLKLHRDTSRLYLELLQKVGFLKSVAKIASAET